MVEGEVREMGEEVVGAVVGEAVWGVEEEVR